MSLMTRFVVSSASVHGMKAVRTLQHHPLCRGSVHQCGGYTDRVKPRGVTASSNRRHSCDRSIDRSIQWHSHSDKLLFMDPKVWLLGHYRRSGRGTNPSGRHADPTYSIGPRAIFGSRGFSVAICGYKCCISVSTGAAPSSPRRFHKRHSCARFQLYLHSNIESH